MMVLISSNSKTITMAKYSKGAGKKVEEAMHEMKQGKLKSGRSGKKVTSRKQAIAIGLSEARERGARVPDKGSKSAGGGRTRAAKKGTKKSASKSAARKSAPRKTASKSTGRKSATRSTGRKSASKSTSGGGRSRITARKSTGRKSATRRSR